MDSGPMTAKSRDVLKVHYRCTFVHLDRNPPPHASCGTRVWEQSTIVSDQVIETTCKKCLKIIERDRRIEGA